MVTVCQLNKDAKTVTLYILLLLHSHIYVFFFFPLCLSQLCVSANFLQKRKEQDQRQFNILQPSFFSLQVFYMQLVTNFLYSDTTYYHKQVHLNLCITVLTFSTIHSSKKKNRLLLEPVTGGYPLLPPHIQNSPSLVSGSLCWAPAVSEPAGGPGSAFPTAWQQWKKIISITKLHIKLLVLSFDFSYAWMNLVKNNRWIKYPWLLIPPVEG